MGDFLMELQSYFDKTPQDKLDSDYDKITYNSGNLKMDYEKIHNEAIQFKKEMVSSYREVASDEYPIQIIKVTLPTKYSLGFMHFLKEYTETYINKNHIPSRLIVWEQMLEIGEYNPNGTYVVYENDHRLLYLLDFVIEEANEKYEEAIIEEQINLMG